MQCDNSTKVIIFFANEFKFNTVGANKGRKKRNCLYIYIGNYKLPCVAPLNSLSQKDLGRTIYLLRNSLVFNILLSIYGAFN